MLISDVSVKRPVVAIVLSMLLVAFGVVSIQRLSLREYPDIDPPIVTVSVNYRGAPANVVESRITQRIEDQVSGIEGIETIQSVSSDGRSRVTLEFSVQRDINEAANDVRDRVSSIRDNLPEEADPPEVEKSDSNDDVIIWQNVSSASMTIAELTDFADRYLVDQYAALEGVARVRIGGGLRYAMRIWLNRAAMAAREVTVEDVEVALLKQNIELPAGTLQLEEQVLKARVQRYFKTPGDFAQLVIKKTPDGHLVRLGEMARVEKGVVEDRLFFRGNGEPMVGIGIIKQSKANTIEVSHEVKQLSTRLNRNLPQGMHISQSYDAAVFVEASIAEVVKTLLIAIGCVILVMYVFLGNVRAMLIPAVTVPIALVAAFIIMDALGFSINLLSLLALVLAIGLVVDDAIVMLENIVRHIQEKQQPPLLAAYLGAKEVGFAVLATTVVLVAVFVPITFLEGDTGRLFTEFAITIVAAVCFSSLVALTLTPALSALFLRSELSNTGLERRAGAVVDKIKQTYIKSLFWVMKKPAWVFLGFVVLLGASVGLFSKTEQAFAPREDRGAFFVIVSAPEGASYRYIERTMTEIESRLMPYVDSGEFKRLLVRAPSGFGNIENFNRGFVIVILADWAQRRPANIIVNEVRQTLSSLPGVRAFPVMRQGLGGGTGKPVQFVIGGDTYDELSNWQTTLLAEIAKDNPGFKGLDGDYKPNRPQIDFNILYHRAADMGVSIEAIGRTLQTLMGGRVVTTFLDKGETYDVIVEGERALQQSFTDLTSIQVRSERTGQLIPLSNLVEITEYGASDALTRFNRVRAITLEANLDDHFALGQALRYLENLAEEHLPEHAVIDYKGQSRDLIASSRSIQFVFLLGVLVVFLVLAAQFESFIHPLIIMITVPLVAGGGLLGVLAVGGTLNIYSQIGLIMLVGLAAKNAILIVEFANQLRDQGLAVREAIEQAAEVRFRPIVMTGLTTLVGTLPLLFTSGAGAETRQAIGSVVFFGVLTSLVLSLYLVPVVYHWLARYTRSPYFRAQQLVQQMGD